MIGQTAHCRDTESAPRVEYVSGGTVEAGSVVGIVRRAGGADWVACPRQLIGPEPVIAMDSLIDGSAVRVDGDEIAC